MLRVPSLRIRLIAAALASLWACEREQGSTAPRNTGRSAATHGGLFPLTDGAHAGTDCDVCHGAFDTFREFDCLGCHDHAREPTDRAHGALATYAYDSARCYACHPRGTALGRIEHDRYYPIGAGTAHEKTECAGCHPSESDRRQIDCISCHSHAEPAMDLAHGSVPDYRWASRACLECHRDGVGLNRDAHDAIFPVSKATKHGQAECSACHEVPEDRKRVTCAGCHPHEEGSMLTAHASTGGYSFSSPLCLRCHGDSSVLRVASHLPFRISVGAKHDRREATCLECHPSTLAEKPFSAAFESFDCFVCHSRASMDRKHARRSGYRSDSVTCVKTGCHPDGGKKDD